MKLCFLFLFLTSFAANAFSAVSKKKLSADVQKGVVAVFKAQLGSGQLPFKGDPNDKGVDEQLRQHAQLWENIINLLPEDQVSDDAAVWIKSSAIRRATFFGPYFIASHSNDATITQTYQYDHKVDVEYRGEISKEMPLLTSARLSHILKQRKEWLIESNDYYTKWRKMVLQFMMNQQTINITDYEPRLYRLPEQLLDISDNSKKYKAKGGIINFVGSWEPSLIMSAALAWHIDQFLRTSYASVWDSIDYAFSPMYFPELFPSFDGIRTFEEVESTSKQKLSDSLIKVNNTNVLSGDKLDRVLWDVAQLQIRLKTKQKDKENDHSEAELGKNPHYYYVAFMNMQSVWEKLMASKADLDDPENLNVLKNVVLWNFDIAEVVKTATE